MRPGAVARTAEIVDHDLRAAATEFEGIGAAQAAACTGDDDDFILERNGHEGLSILVFYSSEIPGRVGRFRGGLQQRPGEAWLP